MKHSITIARIFAQTQTFGHSWLWQDIVAPFLITRFGLLLVGWFSLYFRPGASAPERGWFFSSRRLLDIWGRWDTGWYINIIQNGYTIRGDLQTTQSNIAFFPLYPYLIKGLLYLVPPQFQSLSIVLLIGVLVSNILLLAALIILYKLITTTLQDDMVARRAVLYLLIFPTSFFFSSFYSESAFLFLSVAAFYAAAKQNWKLASALGSLLALTRPLGALIAMPLIWMYFESLAWRLDKIRWNALWFFLIPAAFFGFLLSLYPLTGSLLAPMQVQASWGRTFVMPWVTLFNPQYAHPYLTQVEQALSIGSLLLGVISLRYLRSASYGIYALAILVIPLFSGTLVSNVRFGIVVFPLFIVMAMLGKHKVVNQFFSITLLVLQVLFMVAWSQFYWMV